MPSVSPQPSPAAPPSAVAAALLLLAAHLPAADNAPLNLYGVQLPDPLQVYTLQETKPENIRNDPFLVVFKTHIPSLRPYEIPYFPPKDRLSADEQEDSPPATVASSDFAQEQTTSVSSEPAKNQQSAPTGLLSMKPDEKIDIEALPELVELKPEALLEALDASKQDAEEGQTNRPAGTAEVLSDSQNATTNTEREEVENSEKNTEEGKEKEVELSKAEQGEEENGISKKEDVLTVPLETQNENEN